ncbi:glycosyltransferase family 9 protein [Planctomycetes bacterium Poly30]|uniref:glycosyltransferase family 9 protein n=1 Tax=Saltatorellus ferox TaxID=2528018 RepID=UPI0011A07C9C
MNSLLVIKTGALGDVLRTTSILAGLHKKYPGVAVTWLTADAAKPLVDRHRGIERVVTCDVKDEASIERVAEDLAGITWDWILSLDDEEPLCQLATALPHRRLSGAFLTQSGERAYTDDVEPWFGMGLLSRDGKAAADQRKIDNQRSHPEIFADMFGIEAGRPELPLPSDAVAAAQAFASKMGLRRDTLVVGLNTGAGGRWTSKGLPVDRVVGYARALVTALDQPVVFLVLGGPPERERNDEILAGINRLGLDARAIDGGTENALPTFAGFVGLSDVLLTSDSLALHVGVAMNVSIVSFFAPTSAAEIELYGLGTKVVSTSADYCSYSKTADNSSITVERLVAATIEVLEAKSDQRRLIPRPA